MTDRIRIPRDLKRWASNARFSLTPTAQDGRTVFSNGETSYFIGRGADGLLRVTASDRMGPEHLELAARSPETIERFLYGLFGPDVRYDRHLARARPAERPHGGFGPLPGRFGISSLAEMDQEYLARFDDANRNYLARFDDANRDYLAPPDDANRDYLALIDDQGGITAVDGLSMAVARIRLFDLAIYLSVDTAEIEYAFQQPDGAQLLTVTERGGEGEGTATAKGTLTPG
jgi:hypothetical protein